MAATAVVAVMDVNNAAVKVVKKAGSFLVLGTEGSVELVDNFSLADSVINTQLNGENVVAQLIKRDSNDLRIR